MNRLRLSGIGDHVDVDLAGLGDNEVLVFDLASGDWKPETSAPPGPHNLDSHTDVTLTAPVTGDVIRFSSGSQWVNVASDEIPAHAATHALGGSDPVTSFDPLTADLNLGTNDIVNVGTVTATNLAGTLTTAAQGNVTSLGSLTSLTTGTITMTGAGVHRNTAVLSIILSGGSSTALGGNVQFFGETHVSAANDLEFRTGTTVRLRWDNDVPEWNFQGLNVNNVLTLTATNLGGTLTTVSQPNITTLAGVTTMSNLVTVGILNSGSITSGFGTINIGSSALTAGTSTLSNIVSTSTNTLVRNIATSTMSLSGGTTVALGANIVLYGETEGSTPRDLVFRTDGTDRLRWVHASLEWNFQGVDVTNIGSITDDLLIGTTTAATGAPRLDVVGTSALVVSDTAVAGTKIARVGARHFTNAEEPVLLIGATNSGTANTVFIGGATSVMNAATAVQIYTAATITTQTGTLRLNISSSGAFDFQGNSVTTGALTSTGAYTVSNIIITGTQGLVRDIATSTMSLSGGTTVALGANIVLYGETEGSNALDVVFRASGADKLRWDNSVPEWNFQGLNVNNIGTITATSFGAVSATTGAFSGATTFGGNAAGMFMTGTTGTAETSLRISNTASTIFMGVDATTGARFVGSTNNSGFLGLTTNTALEIATNNNVRIRIASAGDVTFLGDRFVEATGQLGSQQNTGLTITSNAFTFDCNNGNSQTVDNAGTGTIVVTVTNARSGFVYCLKVTATGTAQSDWNWPSTFRWPDGAKPTMTTTTGRDDIITFYRDGSDNEYIAVANLNHF